MPTRLEGMRRPADSFRPRFGIRLRLLALALLAFLPPALLSVHLTLNTWDTAEANARMALHADAEEIFAWQDGAIREVRKALDILVDRPDIKEAGMAGEALCTGILARLRSRMNAPQPIYASLLLSHPETGKRLCGTSADEGEGSFAGEPWFLRLASGSAFEVGEFRFEPRRQRPFLLVSVPVHNSFSQPMSILSASLDLALVTLDYRSVRWEHRSITIFDRQGLILLRSPESDLMGKRFPDSALVRAARTAGSGELNDIIGIDGVRRLQIVRPFHGQETFLAVSVPAEVVFGPARQLAFVNLTILGVTFVGALVTVWFVGDRLILRAVRTLGSGARALLAGDLGARVRLDSGDELQSLGDTFNNMAASLEARNADLDRQRDELIATASRLTATINAVPIAIISLDPHRNVATWSHAAEWIFGYTRAEAVDKPYPLVPPGGREEFDRLTARVMEGGESVRDIAVKRQRKDGRILDVLFSGAPLYDAQRRIIGAVYALEDVTERKKAEEALILNQRIFATSLDLILVTDRQGIFSLVSPSSEALLGYKPEEMIGRSASEFIHPDDLEDTRNEMREARHGGAMRNFECRYRHKDGRNVATLAWTGVWSDAEQRHFFIGRDVTEARKRDEQLAQAQKMETVGQLTGGLAHDFNNLLGVVIGNLDLIQDELPKDHRARPLIDVALEACLRGAQLNKSLLAFSRRQELRPQRVDPAAAVKEMATMLRRIIGDRIALEAVVTPDIWAVRVDMSQLESAILNLAVNARDAMPEGGRLMIEASNAILDDAYAAENSEVTPGEYAMIVISDTGAGMAPETLARVFEPFFTTKEVGKGSGLGLSMVHGFMKQSRGHVKVYSEIGRGTTVRLYLPRDRADPAGGEASANAEDRLLHPVTETVLLVEDNEALRRVAVTKLTKLGYKVIMAANAAEAITAIDEGARPDLLFTDVVMPGLLDGIGLAHAVVKRLPGVKVLLTSGFTERGASGDGRVIPWPLLSKPYRNAELAQALRDALADTDSVNNAAD